MARNFYYSTEAAALLGWTTQWVGRKILNGEIKAFRYRQGRWRISRRELAEFALREGLVLDWDAYQEVQEQRRASKLARRAQVSTRSASATADTTVVHEQAQQPVPV